MKYKNSVSLVVINYNGKKHLKEYFESVFSQTVIPHEVLLMDNMSQDGSREYVKKHFPRVKIIENNFNAGTARGSNIAFQQTSGKYVIFQSNDIRLDKNCIKELLRPMVKDKNIGICTSVLLNYFEEKKSGKYIIDNAGGVVDILGFGMQKYPGKNLSDIPENGDIFFSYGGSFIIRRNIFQKVGGFDYRYFTLNDDIDLSWRVRLLGLKIIYNKKSLVFHKVSATLGTLFDRGIKRYWSERNSLRTLLKNSRFLHLLLVLPIYIALLLGEIAYFLYRLKFSLVFADVRALAWNLLYLPETLSLRLATQRATKNKIIHTLMMKKSLKLQMFNSFRKVL